MSLAFDPDLRLAWGSAPVMEPAAELNTFLKSAHQKGKPATSIKASKTQPLCFPASCMSIYRSRRLLDCRNRRHSQEHIGRLSARQPGPNMTHTPAGRAHDTLSRNHDSLVARTGRVYSRDLFIVYCQCVLNDHTSVYVYVHLLHITNILHYKQRFPKFPNVFGIFEISSTGSQSFSCFRGPSVHDV